MYEVRYWCNDCYGIDPYGCFDGRAEVSEEKFKTTEDAESYAREHGYNESPYQYEMRLATPRPHD